MIELTGIYPALVTPFTDDDQIDDQALRNLTEYLIGKGVQGFYLGGSTGESLLMSKEERKQVIEIVSDQIKGRVRLIAHIGCFHTPDAIDLARHAAQTGADAISSLPPFYYKFTMEELKQYYHRIADAVELPLIVYNAPALTGVSFDSENVEEIFSHPNLAGIKFTSYDLFQMQRMLEKYDKLIINGHDEIYLSALSIGCDMAIGSTFNFMPELFLAIRQQFELGNHKQAARLQGQANEIIECLSRIGVFRGVKGMLEIIGMPCGNCREPFLPLNDGEKSELERVWEKNRLKEMSVDNEFPQYWK